MTNQQKVERQFFSGNTLEQAILAAARHHGLDPDEVAYSLRDKKHGFLNIRRRIVIEVDPESPKRLEGAAEERQPSDSADGEIETASDRDPRPRASFQGRQNDGGWSDGGRNEDRRGRATWYGDVSSWSAEEGSDPERSALEQAIDELNGFMGMELDSSIERDEEGFEVELSGPDSADLREDWGRGLAAAEHLLSRMVRGLSGRGILCRVDSEGFREGHEERLTALAQDAAADVRREGRERRLEPMNPADRRLVHMALADDPSVRTESDGSGFMKRVRILPSED